MSEYPGVKPEALNQLVEMGFDEKEARDALSKYDNDVGRAVEFLFDPMNNLKAMQDWDTSTPHEDSDSFGMNNVGNTIDLTNNDDTQNPLNKALKESMEDSDRYDDDLQRGLAESLKDASNDDNKNNMAVVLYSPKNDSNSQVADDNYANYNWNQPIKRLKLGDTTPLGLKTDNMNHGFAVPFFQALFHIPIFRLAILAYRPTRDNWGEVEGYWEGRSRGLSNEYDSNSHYQDFKSQPYTLKFMHEFQKLFGFMSLSQRPFGDASSLIDALAYEETKSNWNDWEIPVKDFFIKILDVTVHSSTYREYRDLIDLDPGTDSLSKHVMPFERLLKSLGRNKTSRNYYYQSEKKDEDVLCIPLDITPSFNTIYAALDQIVRYKMELKQKVFFTDLAKILIFTLKRDSFTNNFTSGDSGFHIHKELFMDRYLLNRAEDIEKRWHQLESLKSESEEINQAIRRITEYQGRHSGLDLLKSSIDYFRRKCDKARNIDYIDDNAQKTCSFLEGILEKIEQKFKVLIERKDEIDMEIKDIFDTPDMKKVFYRLKAVLVSDVQRHYAYIWVSRGNKTETISNNNENGSWWKFCDTTVEETFEKQVLHDMSGLHVNSNVYSLIYVNADSDHNFSNINDLIPSSLKEYVKRDNHHVLDEEVSMNTQDNNNYNSDYNYNNYNNHNDYNDYNNDYTNNNDNNYNNYNYNNDYNNNNDDNYCNNNGYNNNDYDNDYSTVADQDVAMGDSSRADMYNSDSTVYGSSGNNHHRHKIQCEIETTERQEKNMVSLHPKINNRFEIFCIKLGQIDLFKSLMYKYYKSGHATETWNEPHPLDTRYRKDPDFKEYVELFNKYKEITFYFTEGLDRVTSDEYRNALAYFKHAINLENDWINNLYVTDKNGERIKLNGEKLRRSKEIDAYARACLKVEHEGFLGKIRTKAYRTRGLKDGLLILPCIVGYIGASNCAEDELFKQFGDEFEKRLKESDDEYDLTKEENKLANNLIEEYGQPKEFSVLKFIEPIEFIIENDDDNSLHDQYEAALKGCSTGLKKYEVPYI